MESKTLNEILNKTRRTPNISLTPEQVEELIKDLEVLEILKEKAHLYVNNVNKDVKSIQISITTCDDRFDKVEEWLGK